MAFIDAPMQQSCVRMQARYLRLFSKWPPASRPFLFGVQSLVEQHFEVGLVFPKSRWAANAISGIDGLG